MFGMGIGEILIIAIIAILFLGPDKLPDAMVKIAKFFKTFKNSVNDVKSSFEQEMKIQELKEEALIYKKKLDEAATSARKVVTFDELEEIKKTTQGVNDSLKEIQQTMNSPLSSDPIMDSVTTTSEPLATPSKPLMNELKKEETPHV